MQIEEFKKIDNLVNMAVMNLRVQYPTCLEFEDLKQFAWIKVLRWLPKYDKEKGLFNNYIYYIARQGAINGLYVFSDYGYRETERILKKRSNKFSSNFLRIYNIEIEDNQDILESIHLKQFFSEVEKRIKNISLSHWNCFRLMYIEGYTNKQAAKKLKLNAKSLRHKSYYALSKARELYYEKFNV